MSGGPWAGYWSRGSGPGGCLPYADQTFAPVLDKLWRDFAGDLRTGARVLDLATGDGAVLRRLLASGRRFDLTGIDSAPALPPAPSGIRLKPDVAMERLPFRDRGFDAVTSQFGVEYGDPARIAPEVARVLKPGGVLRFVVHHRGGAIVRHNLVRGQALAWAAGASRVLDKARRLARARLAAPITTPASFRAAVDEARRRFPDQSAAAEFHAAILQALDMGAARPARETLEVLDELETRAGREIGRIEALAGAACDAARVRSIAARLRAAGLSAAEPRPLAMEGAEPFAWLLDGAAPA